MRKLNGSIALLAGLLAVLAWPVLARPSLSAERAKLKVPPDWFNDTTVNWSMAKPWKDGRLEVRRLLGAKQYHQAIKLTYQYKQKNDIGDGHEYPMYIFLGRETCWGVVEYEKFTKAHPEACHAWRDLASAYRYFGEWGKAVGALQQAMNNLPAAPWKIANQADTYAAYGDLYAEQGDEGRAKTNYQQAIRLYPTSDQPYGRHVLARKAAKVQTKVDLLSRGPLPAGLRNGTYTGKSVGYTDNDLVATVTVEGGKVTQIRVQTDDKIEQNATTIIPRRIIAAQSLKVDGITGATVTKDAIVDASYNALKRAGLR
jgi:uncharacterized protein with FMN-binding domain